jgi:hypothetical protein
LHTWGEAGVVKIRGNTSPKMLNKGLTCMFVGYPAIHSSDCYQMRDASKDSYHATRDVTWLHWMYYKSSDQVQKTFKDEEANDDAIKVPTAQPIQEQINDPNQIIQVLQEREEALLQEQDHLIDNAVATEGFSMIT